MKTDPPRPFPRRNSVMVAAICGAMLLVFASLAWLSANRECATFDEPLDVVEAWANTRLGDYRICPNDPPLWSYWAGLPLAKDDIKANLDAESWQKAKYDFTYQYKFSTDTLYRTPGNDADSLLRRSRAMMLILGVLTGGLAACWGWRLAGGAAAIACAALFCFDPNFIAHAPLVKNDVSITLVTLALFMTAWSVGRRARVWNVLLLGLLCGAALCVKFTGLTLGPALALLLAMRAMLPGEWKVLRRTIRGIGRKLAAVAVILAVCAIVSYGFTWSCYRFRAGPSPDPSEHLASQWVSRGAVEAMWRLEHPGQVPTTQDIDSYPFPITMRAVLFMEAHHLLPEAWTNGFLATYSSTRGRWSYLLGEHSLTGWWYYFPLAVLFKTPLATLAAGVLAAWMLLRGMRRLNVSSLQGWWAAACLLVPILVVGSSMMAGNVNLGLRHVLLLYPLAYIGIGVGFAHLWAAHRKAALATGLVLAVGLAVETLAAFPHYIPFFNAAAGGARGGLSLLSDSNLDWGQDLPLLADWQRRHPDVPLYLCYFGEADPGYYGIRYVNLPGSYAPDTKLTRSPRHGVIAISATHLQGTYLSPQLLELYAPLAQQQPIDVLGGSIYLYDQDALGRP